MNLGLSTAAKPLPRHKIGLVLEVCLSDNEKSRPGAGVDPVLEPDNLDFEPVECYW